MWRTLPGVIQRLEVLEQVDRLLTDAQPAVVHVVAQRVGKYACHVHHELANGLVLLLFNLALVGGEGGVHEYGVVVAQLASHIPQLGQATWVWV